MLQQAVAPWIVAVPEHIVVVEIGLLVQLSRRAGTVRQY